MNIVTSAHKTPELAARAFVRHSEAYTAKVGGWVYHAGRPVCQGYAEFAKRLVRNGIIIENADGTATLVRRVPA